MRRVVLLLAMLTTGAAWAEAPDRSPRPVLRPAALAPATSVPEERPRKKPLAGLFSLRKAPQDAEDTAPETPEVAAARTRPADRPKGLGRLFQRTAQPPVKGSVCNDRTIRGTQAGRINGRGACGIPNAVRITQVGGVTLSSPALVECTTAHRLNAWVQNVAQPAVGRKGGGLASMKVLASYACRTRNNRPGARLSEHAKGRAVDIGAFTLKDGTNFNVLRGWRDGTYGPILREMHKGACGRFGTVLGPNADRFHQDHFHFDTAQHRSGAYCR